jgi:integrase/recombinase XerD
MSGPTWQPRQTSQLALAGSISRQTKEIPSTSQARRANQQGSLSLPSEPAKLDRKTREVLRQYEDQLRVRYAEKTAKGYLTVLHQHLAWLASCGLTPQAARCQDLAAYQTDLVAFRKLDGRPYSSDHLMQHVTVLKSFYGFLVRRGHLLTNPTGLLEYPKVENHLPRSILSKEEARRVIEAPDTRSPLGLRDRAILETFYATGIRAGELANLKLSDVDTEDRLLRVLLGKGRKDRNVPLTRPAAEAIEAYLIRGRPKMRGARGSAFLFLAERGGRLYNDALNGLIASWAQKAGIEKHATCHTFRHSAATHLLKGGADIRHIQKLLGHASLSSTERYTRVEISDLKEVIRRAHPRGR